MSDHDQDCSRLWTTDPTKGRFQDQSEKAEKKHAFMQHWKNSFYMKCTNQHFEPFAILEILPSVELVHRNRYIDTSGALGKSTLFAKSQ